MASLLDSILSFGATPPQYLEGLVGQQGIEDLRKKAMTTGAFNALVGYLATPKNQNLGLGTILGNTLMAGQQGAQGVFDQATQDYVTQQKFDEMRRAKELQAKRDQFIANIGQPNATRQVVSQDIVQEPVPAQEGAVAPTFQTQLPAPTVREEQYYDPQVMLQQALQSGALDLPTYLNMMTKKQGTKLLSNKDIEELNAKGFGLPTDRGQKYQQDVATGKIDLVQGTLAPEKADFRVGDIQEFESNGKKITREYQGNKTWKIIGTSTVGGDGAGAVEFLSPEAQLGAAKFYLESGGTLPPLGNSKLAAQARINILNIAYGLRSGKNPDQVVKEVLSNKQNRAAEQQTLKSFAGGIEGRTKRSLNVATDHLFTLEEAGVALKNNDIRAFNAIANRINKEIGVPAPTSFDAVKKIVAGEIVKATTGSAGALGDRQEVEQSIMSANSPEQLLDAIDNYKKLMRGQLEGLELQWVTGTNRPASEFRKGLSKRTLTLLPPAPDTDEASPAGSTSVAPSPIVSTKLPPVSTNPSEQGWVLQIDRTTGVKAYVNPKNTKQYRIVSE